MIVASYKLERIPAAKSTNVKIIIINVKADPTRYRIGKGLSETVPETDHNSLQVERKVTL